jgi:Alcohol dehydrogenase GroES-associated
MKALPWHSKRDVRVDNVPDPTIQESTLIRTDRAW